MRRAQPGRRDSDFVFLRVLFDVHVFELAGLEDLAALFAFDEFAVFVAAHDLHARVLAGLLNFYAWAPQQVSRTASLTRTRAGVF